MSERDVRRSLFADTVAPGTGERFEELVRCRNVTIERIVSSDAPEPGDYVQPQDEWVAVLEGSADVEVSGMVHALGPGDWLWLPAGTPHRVLRTTRGTVWLAVHIHEGVSPTRAPAR
jgi:cupin 2 domain-containing protein